MALYGRLLFRNTTRQVVKTAPRVRFFGSSATRRYDPISSVKPEELSKVTEDIEFLKEQDKTHLFLLAQQLSITIKWLKANKPDALTLEKTVQSAGAQDYICVDEVNHNRNLNEKFNIYDSALEVLLSHVEDLRIEEYPEWDFTKSALLSKAETEALELQISNDRESLERYMTLFKKSTYLMEDAEEAYKNGGFESAKKTLKNGARAIMNHVAGAGAERNVPWSTNSDTTRKGKKGAGKAEKGDKTKDADPESSEAEAEAGDEWLNHARLMEEDLGR